MTDKSFAIVTVAVSGVFGLLVAVITHWLSMSRESQSLRRDLARDEMKSLGELYEDALFVLDRQIRTYGMGTDADQDRVLKLLARLSLYGRQDVQDKYQRASELIDTWCAERNAADPKRMGGSILIFTTSDREHRAKAEVAWPAAERAFNELKALMREHLQAQSTELIAQM